MNDSGFSIFEAQLVKCPSSLGLTVKNSRELAVPSCGMAVKKFVRILRAHEDLLMGYFKANLGRVVCRALKNRITLRIGLQVRWILAPETNFPARG